MLTCPFRSIRECNSLMAVFLTIWHLWGLHLFCWRCYLAMLCISIYRCSVIHSRFHLFLEFIYFLNLFHHSPRRQPNSDTYFPRWKKRKVFFLYPERQTFSCLVYIVYSQIRLSTIKNKEFQSTKHTTTSAQSNILFHWNVTVQTLKIVKNKKRSQESLVFLGYCLHKLSEMGFLVKESNKGVKKDKNPVNFFYM